MAPEKKKLAKDIATYFGIASFVAGVIYGAGVTVATAKNTAMEVVDVRAQLTQHKKEDIEDHKEVTKYLIELKVEVAKTNQSLIDLKETIKREVRYHRQDNNR